MCGPQSLTKWSRNIYLHPMWFPSVEYGSITDDDDDGANCLTTYSLPPRASLKQSRKNLKKIKNEILYSAIQPCEVLLLYPSQAKKKRKRCIYEGWINLARWKIWKMKTCMSHGMVENKNKNKDLSKERFPWPLPSTIFHNYSHTMLYLVVYKPCCDFRVTKEIWINFYTWVCVEIQTWLWSLKRVSLKSVIVDMS